ncbi:unnamed protein product [Amoebophrya sp. A120]|nr:unnamed protein product [Amoebophrya sp. A120]|eukprot:GSA120T00010876001.1
MVSSSLSVTGGPAPVRGAAGSSFHSPQQQMQKSWSSTSVFDETHLRSSSTMEGQHTTSRFSAGSTLPSLSLSPRTTRIATSFHTDSTGFRLPTLSSMELTTTTGGKRRHQRSSSTHSHWTSENSGFIAGLPQSRHGTRPGKRGGAQGGSPQEAHRLEIASLKNQFENNVKWIANTTERLLGHDDHQDHHGGSPDHKGGDAGHGAISKSQEFLNLRGQFGSMRERLEYFRFHKALEPKLAPMKENFLCPSQYLKAKEKSPRSNAVLKNTKPDVILSYKKENRVTKYLEQGQLWEEKIKVRTKWKRQKHRQFRLDTLYSLRKKQMHYPILGSTHLMRTLDVDAWELQGLSPDESADEMLRRILVGVVLYKFTQNCDEILQNSENETFLTQFRSTMKEKRRQRLLEEDPDALGGQGLRPPGESSTDEEKHSAADLAVRQKNKLRYLRFKMALRIAVRTYRRIRKARILYSTMQTFASKMLHWNTILAFQGFNKKTRLIQRFWRDCRIDIKAKLKLYLQKANKFEMRHHRRVFIDRHGGAVSPPSQAQLRALLIPEKDRFLFITMELRARRYLSLTGLAEYRRDWRDYEEQVEKWRQARYAAKLMGSEVGAMPFPPPYPISYPTEKEMPDVVERYMNIFMHRALKRLGDFTEEEKPQLFLRYTKELAERKPEMLADDDAGDGVDGVNEVSLETLFLVRLRLDEAPVIPDLPVAPNQEVKKVKYMTRGTEAW